MYTVTIVAVAASEVGFGDHVTRASCFIHLHLHYLLHSTLHLMPYVQAGETDGSTSRPTPNKSALETFLAHPTVQRLDWSKGPVSYITLQYQATRLGLRLDTMEDSFQVIEVPSV